MDVRASAAPVTPLLITPLIVLAVDRLHDRENPLFRLSVLLPRSWSSDSSRSRT